MNRVAAFMKDNEGTKVVVEGHTDSRGSAEYNQQLSERSRARRLRTRLPSAASIAARVEAVGRGKDLPVASNRQRRPGNSRTAAWS